MSTLPWLGYCLLLVSADPAPAISPEPPAASVSSTTLSSEVESADPVESSLSPAETVPEPEEPDWWDILTHTLLAEQRSLSWITSTGAGRFNIIDWEARATWDRLWWLSRWPGEDHFYLVPALGFNIHWWAGPVETAEQPGPDLPPRVYDLYLDLTWSQRWSERLTSQVHFAPGLYTDFRTTPPDAFRVPGWGAALFTVTPELHLVGGAENLQRNDIKVLPVAGVLWQPTPGCELRLLFPSPRIAVELSAERGIWGYVGGEYGGGRWSYKNDQGHSDRVEYSDLRLTFGMEWREGYRCCPLSSLKDAGSFLEMGWIFDRHLRQADGGPNFDPKPAWMIRFGTIW